MGRNASKPQPSQPLTTTKTTSKETSKTNSNKNLPNKPTVTVKLPPIREKSKPFIQLPPLDRLKIPVVDKTKESLNTDIEETKTSTSRARSSSSQKEILPIEETKTSTSRARSSSSQKETFPIEETKEAPSKIILNFKHTIDSELLKNDLSCNNLISQNNHNVMNYKLLNCLLYSPSILNILFNKLKIYINELETNPIYLDKDNIIDINAFKSQTMIFKFSTENITNELYKNGLVRFYLNSENLVPTISNIVYEINKTNVPIIKKYLFMKMIYLYLCDYFNPRTYNNISIDYISNYLLLLDSFLLLFNNNNPKFYDSNGLLQMNYLYSLLYEMNLPEDMSSIVLSNVFTLNECLILDI
jgi:hypothetical protein